MLALRIYNNTHITLQLPDGEQVVVYLITPTTAKLAFEAPRSVEITRSDAIKKEPRERSRHQ